MVKKFICMTALLRNLCDLIVNLLYFIKMKTTQLPNML